MKTETVPYSEKLNFESDYTLKIENYKWMRNHYEPKVQVFLIHNNDSLKIRFKAFETEIRFVEKSDNGEIYCDSCVELFLRPFSDDERYINFEINPIGAMIMSLGETRNDRIECVYNYKKHLNVSTQIFDEYWLVDFTIPFSMLNEIYQTDAMIQPKCNFYKCGDKTAFPHYGMWNKIISEKPDFHRPEFFGELILAQNEKNNKYQQ